MYLLSVGWLPFHAADMDDIREVGCAAESARAAANRRACCAPQRICDQEFAPKIKGVAEDVAVVIRGLLRVRSAVRTRKQL